MQSKKEWIPVFIQAVAFAGLLIFSLMQYYPLVGMDYKYFIPRLLDSDLHYRINGLSIQWYTPSFGGGLPSYANPQQIQFSIPQLLTLFINPWAASLVSIVLFVHLGMAGTYILSRNILKLDPWASLLAASFFVVNGFYIQHMGIGHLTFMAFPLLPWLIIGLIRDQKPWINGGLIGLVFATLLYGGGFYPIVYFLISALLCLSLIFAFFPTLFNAGRLGRNIFWGALFTGMVSASKLSAVMYFLRNFPRVVSDEYSTTLLQSLKSIPFQLLGSMSLAPVDYILGKGPKNTWETLMGLTGSNLPSWELDISISPVLIIYLAMGSIFLIMDLVSKKTKLDRTQVVSILLLICTFEVTVEFIIAKGYFYTTLSQLPILKSLHVNPRYTAALIFPLAVGGGISVHSIFQRFSTSSNVKFSTWLISTFLILVFACVYLVLPMDTLQRRQFDLGGSLDIYTQIRAGERYTVKTIQEDLNDARVFDQNASTLRPYEVLFGYGMREFKPTLMVGPVDLIREDTYNLNDPTGFVFGEVNDTQPFDRIKLVDRANFLRFIHREQPDWKIPLPQLLANFISALAIFIIVVLLPFHRIISKFRGTIP